VAAGEEGQVAALDEEFTTLAELLAAAGYRTGAVVSGVPLTTEFGLAQGFQTYYDEPPGQGKLPWGLHGRRAEATADRAIALLDQLGTTPRFLFVHFWDPHDPYRPPPPFDRDLPPGSAALPPATREAFLERIVAGETSGWAASMGPEEHAGLARLRAAYDAEITYMDHHLGRLLDAIAASPRADDTMVVITADHGESLGEHYYVGHALNLYEHCVRVPLIVRYPGQRTGRRVARPVQNHWLFASILGAAGVELPAPVEATDLDAGTGVVFTETRYRGDATRRLGPFFDRDLRALYAPPHKLIESSTGARELFDLERDPGETVNLAARESSLALALSAHLRTIEAGHPLLRNVPAAAMRRETEDALRALGYIE
jgi:arylsulfatase A-like enzyme